MSMLIFTFLKTQSTLAVASSFLFFSALRPMEIEAAQGQLLLENEEAGVDPAKPEEVAPVAPKKAEEK